MDAFGTYGGGGGGGGWPTKSPDSPPDPPLQSIHGDVQKSPICARFFPFTQNLDCKQSLIFLCKVTADETPKHASGQAR